MKDAGQGPLRGKALVFVGEKIGASSAKVKSQKKK